MPQLQGKSLHLESCAYHDQDCAACDEMIAESDPAIGDLSGFLGAGSTCSQCGFQYMAYKGHILPCPVCALAALQQRVVEAERERRHWEDGCKALRTDLARCREALDDIRGEADSDKPGRDPEAQLTYIVNRAEDAQREVKARRV